MLDVLVKLINEANAPIVQSWAGAAQAILALALLLTAMLQSAIYMMMRRDGIERDRAFAFVKRFAVQPGGHPINPTEALMWRAFPFVGNFHIDFDFPDFSAEDTLQFDRPRPRIHFHTNAECEARNSSHYDIWLDGVP